MSDENIPAFPVTGENCMSIVNEGMTLRDYFAGKELSKIKYVSVGDNDLSMDRQARHCYKMADAMLRARKNYI